MPSPARTPDIWATKPSKGSRPNRNRRKAVQQPARRRNSQMPECHNVSELMASAGNALAPLSRQRSRGSRVLWRCRATVHTSMSSRLATPPSPRPACSAGGASLARWQNQSYVAMMTRRRRGDTSSGNIDQVRRLHRPCSGLSDRREPRTVGKSAADGHLPRAMCASSTASDHMATEWVIGVGQEFTRYAAVLQLVPPAAGGGSTADDAA